MNLIGQMQKILDHKLPTRLLEFIPLIPAEKLIYENACFYDHGHIARIWIRDTNLNVILSSGGLVSITYYPLYLDNTISHNISSAKDFRYFFGEQGDAGYLAAQQSDKISFRENQSFGLSITNEEPIVQNIEYSSLQYIEYEYLNEAVYAAKTLLERDWLPWIKIFSSNPSQEELLRAAVCAPKNILRIVKNHPKASEDVQVAISLRT
jgi:hypothetical protein